MKKITAKIVGAWLNLLAFISPGTAAVLGLKIFGSPMRAEVNKKHLAFFGTADQSIIQHDGFKVQVYRWGHGPTKVLFLHGWQSHTYRWKKYIEAFDQHLFTLFAFDGVAHGLSEGSFFIVPTYTDLIETFIAERGKMDVFIAHSMGCFASLHAFYRKPEITPGSAVLLASPGESQEFFDQFKAMFGLSQRASSIMLKHFEEKFDRAIGDFSAPRFASNLTIPGLLIHDSDDDDTSVEHSRNINRTWPNSRLVVTKGLGHNLKSEEVVTLVHSFVMATTTPSMKAR